MDRRNRKETELSSSAVTVMWCVCEHCAALSPRSIRARRRSTECVTPLRQLCCMSGTAKDR